MKFKKSMAFFPSYFSFVSFGLEDTTCAQWHCNAIDVKNEHFYTYPKGKFWRFWKYTCYRDFFDLKKKHCFEWLALLSKQLESFLATQIPRTKQNEWTKNFSRATYMTNKWPQKKKLVELRDQTSNEIMKLKKRPSFFSVQVSLVNNTPL